jgi:hypothetical protein
MPEPAGAFGSSGTSTLVGASLARRFGRSSVQLYVLGGIDMVRHSGTVTYDTVVTDRSSTDWGYHGGGGVAARLGVRFEVGPEARFYMIQPENDSSPAAAYWIGVRAGVRF